MRLRHPSGRIVRLSYEITPKPARRLPAVIAQLDTYAAVRTMLGADALGVSLWLPPALAAALAVAGRTRTRLRAELDARRLEVVALSGASFGEDNGSPSAGGGGECTSHEERHNVQAADSASAGKGADGVSAGMGGDGVSAGKGGDGVPAGMGGDGVSVERGGGGGPAEEGRGAGPAADGRDDTRGGDEERDGAASAGSAPGWDEPARREYTLDLARVLVDLLPEDAVRGCVGTIGLGRRAGWDEAAEKASAGLLRRLSAGLADLAWQNGRAVRVGFQPADGYVLDSPEEIVAALTRIDKDRLGVRLDLDHVTRAWPDPAAGIETVTDAGISIVEARLTASPGPAIDAWRAALAQLLGPDGPQTEFLTLAGHVPDPSAEQIASDIAYLMRELAALGLAPENEPCAV